MCTIGRTAGGTAGKLIIGQTVRNIRYGTDRKERITRQVVLFLFSEHHVSAQTAAESLRGRHRRKQVQSHHAGKLRIPA